jgi:hypothetical protein
MTVACVFVVGVLCVLPDGGPTARNVQQSYKNWIEEEKKQDFALMGSQRVVAGKTKSLFFFQSRKRFSSFREQPTAFVLIEYLLAGEQKRVNRKETSLLSRQNTHINTHRNCKKKKNLILFNVCLVPQRHSFLAVLLRTPFELRWCGGGLLSFRLGLTVVTPYQ